MEEKREAAAQGQPDVAVAATPSLTGLASDLRTVDMYPEVAPMLDTGVARFSRAIIGTLSAQVEGTTAELAHLERVNGIVAAEYGRLSDGVTSVQRFCESYRAQGESLMGELYETHLTTHRYRIYSRDCLFHTTRAVDKLRPILLHIDALDEATTGLEALAVQLHAQSKELEATFADLLVE